MAVFGAEVFAAVESDIENAGSIAMPGEVAREFARHKALAARPRQGAAVLCHHSDQAAIRSDQHLRALRLRPR